MAGLFNLLKAGNKWLIDQFAKKGIKAANDKYDTSMQALGDIKNIQNKYNILDSDTQKKLDDLQDAYNAERKTRLSQYRKDKSDLKNKSDADVKSLQDDQQANDEIRRIFSGGKPQYEDGDIIKVVSGSRGKLDPNSPLGEDYYIYQAPNPVYGTQGGFIKVNDFVNQVGNSGKPIKFAYGDSTGNPYKLLDPSNSSDKAVLDTLKDPNNNPTDNFLRDSIEDYTNKYSKIDNSKQIQGIYAKRNSDYNDLRTNARSDLANKKSKFETNKKGINDQYSVDKNAINDEILAYRTKSNAYGRARDQEIEKARLPYALGVYGAEGLGGAGALYAGARSIFGNDDSNETPQTTTTTTTTNTNTSNENAFGINKPEEQSILTGSRPLPGSDRFNPDEADALASAAYDKGVEDAAESTESDANELTSNDIVASTGGHTMDDGLFEVIKNLQDPHQANALANYIYNRYGNDKDLQRLGWRAWLNKMYGDSLREKMHLDASSRYDSDLYKGLHI